MVTAESFSRRYSVRSRSTSRDARGERSTTYSHQFYIWGEPLREGQTSIVGDRGAIRSEETYRLRAVCQDGIEVGYQLVDDDGVEVYVRSAIPVDAQRRQVQLVVAMDPAGGT